jgi:RimJ/RimL family protein N-acetyltransferase
LTIDACVRACRWWGGCSRSCRGWTLERLEAVTDVGNARSQRALEKAGFQREGVLRSYIVRRGPGGVDARDAAVYSFLSSDRPRLG